MNPEVKAAWLAWLRDPKNKQGKGRLRNDKDEFCCLGGLCELAAQAGVGSWERVEANVGYGTPWVFNTGNCKESAVMPFRVAVWAGLAGQNPRVEIGNTSLAELNDKRNFSFLGIADVIEREL